MYKQVGNSMSVNLEPTQELYLNTYEAATSASTSLLEPTQELYLNLYKPQ